MSPSQGETVDITVILRRQRSQSSTASDSGFEGTLSAVEEEPMSIESQSPISMSPGPAFQQMRARVRYCSESDGSLTSQVRLSYISRL